VNKDEYIVDSRLLRSDRGKC